MRDIHSDIENSGTAAEFARQFRDIHSDPKFLRLVTSRNRLVTFLLTVIFLGYFAFLAMVCGYPSLVAKPLYDGAGLTVGVAAELLLFIIFLAISAIYVTFANGRFDGLLSSILTQGKGRR